MGVVMANQEQFAVRHIVEFKENLRVLLLSSLFILVAARIPLDAITNLGLNDFLFLAVVMFVARPLGVALSTIGSELTYKERFFLSMMAPRGIVAASVASIFALEVSEAGFPEAEAIVPLTFLVIIGTVTIYGLISIPLSRRLGLSEGAPQGVLFLGAHSWAREIAKAVQGAGFPVLLVDSNRDNVNLAQMEGLPSYYGNVLSDMAQEEISLEGLGRLLALTPNEEVNSLASIRFADVFGSGHVYQLPAKEEQNRREGAVARPLRGQYLFGEEITYNYLQQRTRMGDVIKITRLTSEFGFEDLKEHYEGQVVPLFLVTETGELLIYSAESSPTPQPGQNLIFLAEPQEELAREVARQTQSREGVPYPKGTLPT
jgi:hypothetical protein